jgi:lysophospholipase L1-like esterase
MKWRGKTWLTLGDSITAANGYQPLVQEALGFARVVNLGRGGCPMTAGGATDAGSTVRVGWGLPPGETYDCITIFAGTNDYRLNKPLGPPGATDPECFRGACDTLLRRLLADRPGARVALWTPLQRNKDGYDIFSVNEAGHRMADYVQAIRDVGVRYALPVLDLYSTSGIADATLAYFTDDGLHPNARGHARIAGMASSFLASL